ncbi:MAG: MFS transporter [Deltaproteobacteria bacterium]|nr:MAG: MFS transporter [Deltaproteobacteria bacterium]
MAFETDIPARLDRLPWSRFHWLVVVALGITWALDGLEVTIVGALGGVLEEPGTLGLSATQVGLAGTVYIAGALIGALLFGHLTDRHGRKRLFLITLSLYVLATSATAFSVDFWTFAACRFLTGMGIGGEYAAINSAIDELIPARVRGFTDLAINGSYWLGTALGAVLSAVLLDPRVLGHELGWRAAFGLGALLALGIMVVRRFVPESPRWLLVRGRHVEAQHVVAEIEARCAAPAPGAALPRIRVAALGHISFRTIAREIFAHYRSRALLGLALMIAQAFFYNAIFFTYALTLTRFYAVPAERVGAYLLPFALGNFLGPLLLGSLFDAVGRRPMIAFTYAASGILLLATGVAFVRGALDAHTHTWMWSLSFFFASAAASSAYLTVSELFPLEIRAMAIALFYAVGTGAGGLVAPALFGALIQSGSRHELFLGYALAAALMLLGALAALALGVAAERRPLEELARPLSWADD